MWGMSGLKYYITFLTTAHSSSINQLWLPPGRTWILIHAYSRQDERPGNLSSQQFAVLTFIGRLHDDNSRCRGYQRWRQSDHELPSMSSISASVGGTHFCFEVKPPSQGLRNRQLEGKVRAETILPARARHFRPIQRHQPLFVGLPSWHVDYKRRVFLSGSLSQRRGTSPETLVSCIIVTVRSKESKWLNTGRGKLEKLDLVSQGWVEPLPTCVDPTLKPELKMIPTASSPRCESGIRSFPTSLVTQWLCWNKSRNAQLWTTGDWAPLSTLLGL